MLPDIVLQHRVWLVRAKPAQPAVAEIAVQTVVVFMLP